MAYSSKSPRLQSWITPHFAWVDVPDAFVVVVSAYDREIVEFISKGRFEVALNGNKRSVRAISALLGHASLRGELHEAVWNPTKLMPAKWTASRNRDVNAYFIAAFLLPDGKHLGIVVSKSPLTAESGWLPRECKAMADELLRDHEIVVAEFDEKMRLKEKQNEELFSRPGMEPYKNIAVNQLAAERANLRPILTADQLLPLLPTGVTLEVRTSEPATLASLGIAAIAKAGAAPSREGSYFGILPAHPRNGALGILTWTPHVGLPSYPEVRSAVQLRVPSAFCKPRQVTSARPEFGAEIIESLTISVIGEPSVDIYQALDDLQLDQPDASSRAQEIRCEQGRRGFEAVAWYQAYHIWSEETWGIYLDAPKLDDLAYSIYEDLRDARLFASHNVAAFLAFGLTYAHELFHARVEAAASWLELNALQARYLRYSRGVYEKLRETSDWLEEALANWSSWEWSKSDDVQSVIAPRISNGAGLERVITSTLDLSPPGYREWRKGSINDTWRTFASQLAIGKPMLPRSGIGLPLDSIVKGPLPYDFRASDIPLRFVGKGVIADRLQSRPATFNVPSRREIEKALKHFKHAVDPSGGKGGHQKWTGPDQRAFILPTRDPVSPGVFKTFLHHVGIDKATYLQAVRPIL